MTTNKYTMMRFRLSTDKKIFYSGKICIDTEILNSSVKYCPYDLILKIFKEFDEREGCYTCSETFSRKKHYLVRRNNPKIDFLYYSSKEEEKIQFDLIKKFNIKKTSIYINKDILNSLLNDFSIDVSIPYLMISALEIDLREKYNVKLRMEGKNAI